MSTGHLASRLVPDRKRLDRFKSDRTRIRYLLQGGIDAPPIVEQLEAAADDVMLILFAGHKAMWSVAPLKAHTGTVSALLEVWDGIYGPADTPKKRRLSHRFLEGALKLMWAHSSPGLPIEIKPN